MLKCGCEERVAAQGFSPLGCSAGRAPPLLHVLVVWLAGLVGFFFWFFFGFFFFQAALVIRRLVLRRQGVGEGGVSAGCWLSVQVKGDGGEERRCQGPEAPCALGRTERWQERRSRRKRGRWSLVVMAS